MILWAVLLGIECIVAIPSFITAVGEGDDLRERLFIAAGIHLVMWAFVGAVWLLIYGLAGL